ncbi:DUF3886 domain-containing protein [Planococcus halotolerans]|uniref:DUF3886 domain-containing protein n=1 Tax=Planococcus halotolerans TaxID=2233542 RepID=A0A365L192_9BACL|nr:DUF3886 domain-containing protein [Planococcus halotolerans]QHJ71087.1 DUF3886 domain-containing protein [Planococcus halotolerans]RAZ79152.1 DUF3886 domain-containing protein [Planococcus halotolerans]
MAKKDDQANGLFNEEVLAKLKDTKKALQAQEQQRREEEEAKRLFERKQREKNMSFAELLEKHGDHGSKF